MGDVEELDEGLDRGALEDLLLGHGLVDLLGALSDTGNKNVGIGTLLVSLESLNDDGLLTSITAVEDDDDLTSLDAIEWR